ncbi:MAG: 16S rRNA (uracil(1498)-N(3))-methyltransferase [Bacteroidales bacterium]|jgi:16S rRNA (uracil1498-N3)-methyltransferase|nr:16S rRNA (uracil(1498)-N(3))-methyltransferase [Bacteroidales bacterium]
MQIFHAPRICGDTYALDETESRHIIKALRMVAGDAVRLIDGRGNLYEGIISSPDPRRCIIQITATHESFEKTGYRLHIAISPLKNVERFEWFIEKSVEIGIAEITPLICRRTEKQTVNTARLERIVISAMKQSLKALAPTLNTPESFDSFMAVNREGVKMIAHCNEHVGSRLSIPQVCQRGADTTVLIGPEGDFTEDEITAATLHGCIPVHLGRSRLRTETAGIAACHSVYVINTAP